VIRSATNDFSAVVQQFRCHNAQQPDSVATVAKEQWQERAKNKLKNSWQYTQLALKA